VNHLDDGGEDGVGVREFAGGFAGEEDEEGAEHFSAEAADVAAEGVDAGEVAGEFSVEAFLDGVEFRADAFAESVEDRGARL
jgi:hypothetical protein